MRQRKFAFEINWPLTLFILLLVRKWQEIWKNLYHRFELWSDSVNVKFKRRIFFKFFWPSHIIWTLFDFSNFFLIFSEYINFNRSHTDNTKTDESSLKLCMCANTISPAAKGQLISKRPFGVSKSTKKTNDFFKGFLP